MNTHVSLNCPYLLYNQPALFILLLEAFVLLTDQDVIRGPPCTNKQLSNYKTINRPLRVYSGQ